MTAARLRASSASTSSAANSGGQAAERLPEGGAVLQAEQEVGPEHREPGFA